MAITIVTSSDTINAWKEKTNDISADVGDITQLTTDSDADVVHAINSIDSNLGARETLTTIDNSNVVAAINEHDAELGDSALTTTAQTIRGAINEHDAEIGDSALTTTGQTLRSAINEHDAEIGNMTLTGLTATDLSAAARELRTEVGDVTALTTAEKTNTVGAIVEIVDRVDSLDALLDQPVLRTSAVDFASVTTGDTVLDGNGITHPLTYTVDAGANIILDAASAGGVIMRRSGVTKFTFKDSGSQHQVIDVPGTMHLHAGDDIRLNAGGGDWILEDANITQFQFSGVGVGNKRMSILTGNFEIDTQAATGQINLQAGASGKVVHSAGGTEMMNFTTGSINRTGSLTIDASANITLDADGGNVYFKDGGATQMTFTGGTNKQIVVASGDLTVDAPGNVTIDADGGNVYFTGLSGNNQFLFAGGVDKEIDIPTGNLTIDVAGDVNIDAGGGDITFKDDGATTLAFSGGTVARTGTFTIDASVDIVLDAGGADVLLKDDGTAYGSLTNSGANLTIKSGTQTALTFSGAVSGGTKRAATFNGPIFATDSALSDSMGGRSLVGAMNYLFTNLQSASEYAGTLSLNTSATNLTAAVNELDAEHGILANLTTTTKTNFVAVINELHAEIGNASLSTVAQTLSGAINELDTDVGIRSTLQTTNTSSLVAAINELNSRNTDTVGEGLANQYFTNARARTAVGVTASTGLAYNSSTGKFSGTDATTTAKGVASFNTNHFAVSGGAVSLDLAAANSGAGYGALSYNSASNTFTLTKVTDANIRERITATTSGTGYGGLSYNSSTGAITYTKVTDADIRGRFSGTAPVSISAGGAISVGDASTSAKGIASFNVSDFSVSNGVVSLSSSAGDLAAGSVAHDRLANVAANSLLGRDAGTAGAPSSVKVKTAMIDNDQVTYGKMQNVATANRLLGSTSAGGQISEVQVSSAMIATGAVTGAKLSNSTTLNIKNSSGTTLFSITGIG